MSASPAVKPRPYTAWMFLLAGGGHELACMKPSCISAMSKHRHPSEVAHREPVRAEVGDCCICFEPVGEA